MRHPILPLPTLTHWPPPPPNSLAAADAMQEYHPQEPKDPESGEQGVPKEPTARALHCAVAFCSRR